MYASRRMMYVLRTNDVLLKGIKVCLRHKNKNGYRKHINLRQPTPPLCKGRWHPKDDGGIDKATKSLTLPYVAQSANHGEAVHIIAEGVYHQCKALYIITQSVDFYSPTTVQFILCGSEIS